MGFFTLLAQLYLSFGSWVPLTPLSSDSSLGRENSAEVAQPRSRLGFAKVAPGNAERQGCLRNNFSSTLVQPLGNRVLRIIWSQQVGKEPNLDCQWGILHSCYLSSVQYDFIAPRKNFFSHVHLTLKCTSKRIR